MTLMWMTAGESHGPALVGIISGLPAGLDISVDGINRELARRQKGAGRSERQEIERDRVEILTGIRHGVTMGSPIGVMVKNRDHENWGEAMSVSPPETEIEDKKRAYPRPGHADLAGMLKWGFDDARNVLERASGRTTAVTVAIGAICRQYLEHFNLFIGSRLLTFGSEWFVAEDEFPPTRAEIGDDPSILHDYGKLSEEQADRIKKVVETASGMGDTAGGTVQVVAAHVPPGLGSSALPDTRLDSRLAGAVMGVPGIKGVEIGAGIDQAYMGGLEAHDQYALSDDSKIVPWFSRTTNLAGGIEGGITNGEPVCLTAWMKPISTVRPPHMSIDGETRKAVEPESAERSDVAAVESAACVLEAVVAMELAKVYREKFGGDSIEEVDRAVGLYQKSIE